MEWLVGFYDSLNNNNLHLVDRVHLEELIVWHKTKESEHMGDMQPIAGPLR